LISLLMVAGLTSCRFITYTGNAVATEPGPLVAKTCEVCRDFSAIVLSGAADVSFTQADEYAVSIKADSTTLSNLLCQVEDGTLRIESIGRARPVRRSKLDVKIQAPVLKAITVNGAADFDLSTYKSDSPLSVTVNGAGDLSFSHLTVPAVSVTVNGAGDIDLESIEVEDLFIEMNGAGDAEVSGHAAKAELRISGAGDVDIRNLAADNVTTSKNGVGRIRR